MGQKHSEYSNRDIDPPVDPHSVCSLPISAYMHFALNRPLLSSCPAAYVPNLYVLRMPVQIRKLFETYTWL